MDISIFITLLLARCGVVECDSNFGGDWIILNFSRKGHIESNLEKKSWLKHCQLNISIIILDFRIWTNIYINHYISTKI